MKKSPIQFRNSLLWRFSAIFVGIVALSGSLQVLISTWGWRTLLEESEQQIYWNLASDLAEQIQPVVLPAIPEQNLQELLYSYTIANPKREFLLLDAQGNILSAVPDKDSLSRKQISLEPIKLALRDETPKLPLYGDNPFDGSAKTIFSVAPLRIGQTQGYLYIPLMGATYEFFIRNTGQFYLIRTIFWGIIISWLFAILSGSLLLWMLGRRFRLLTSAIEKFRAGDLDTRAVVPRDDELGRVSETFNEMAATISANTQQLKEKDAIRRRLIANISHDLRGPVTSMLAHLEALRERKLSVEEQKNYLEVVYECTESQRELVEDLFGLATLEANEAKPDRDYCSFLPIIQSVFAALEISAKKKEISLTLSHGESVPLIYVDSRMIQRVFMNLVSNAIRYTPKGGWVEVKIDPQFDGLQVEVSDSGIGIPPEEIELVFDSFYRANTHRPEDPGGTGLGLAIVQRLLALHGVTPRVRSVVDKGTTFSVSLPFGPPGEAEIRAND